MATLNLPDDMRVIDLVRFASQNGQRVVWRKQGLCLKPELEPINHDASPADTTVTRLRPSLRVLDGGKS